MATSDSPLSVPDITLEVARQAGDGGSGPIAAPSISSVSGTFGQGNTVTLSGDFSAQNSSQLLYLRGNDVAEGELLPDFTSLGGTTPSEPFGINVYTSTSEDSFSKGGRSFGATFNPNMGNPAFYIETPTRELFWSMEIWASTDQATEIPNDSEQYKWTRIVSGGVPEGHNALPDMWVQRDYVSEGKLKYELVNGTVRTRYRAYAQDLVTGDPWEFDAANGNRVWYRQVMHFANQSAEGVADARNFMRIIDHSTNKQIPFTERFDQTDRTWIDGASTPNPSLSWLAPAVHEIKETNGVAQWNEPNFNPLLTHVVLPFYSRNGGVRCLFDCIYLNDSAERVELGDTNNMDTCGKLVVQKQVNRTTTGISFEVEEGNFLPSDDIYAFVVNNDTQYTAGYLIRSGT